MTKTTQSKSQLKPTNIPWLGDIPADWEVRRLKQVFKYVTGATPDTGKNNYYSDDGFNWITISDLNGKYTKDSKNKITQIAVDQKNMTIVPKGALLYSFKLSVGQMSFVELPTYTNEAIFAILPSNNLNLDFWYYALGSYMQNSANENIYGAKIFNQDSIDNALLICPPLTTQQAIVEYLDSKTNLISQFISDKQTMITRLKEQKQSLIHNAVTGKIPLLRGGDEVDGVDIIPKINNLNTNSKLRSTSLSHSSGTPQEENLFKPTNIPWLGDIPADWEVVKLKYLGRIRSGEMFSNLEVKNSGTYEIFGGNGLIGYSEKFNVENECIIIGRVGAKCGNVRHIKQKKWITDNALIFELKNSEIYNYLTFILELMDLNNLSESNAQPLITGSKIIEQQIPLPPLPTQQAIVKYLDIETAKIDTLIDTITQEIELTREYKQSLIYKAVTGKISVE